MELIAVLEGEHFKTHLLVDRVHRPAVRKPLRLFIVKVLSLPVTFS